jgi:hypothetical protein
MHSPGTPNTLSRANLSPALPSEVATLVANPDQLTGKQHAAAYREALRISGEDPLQNFTTPSGENKENSFAIRTEFTDANGTYARYRAGAHFPRLFAFENNMLGQFDDVPDRRADWNGEMQTAAMGSEVKMTGNKYTHVFFRMSDDSVIAIRRTPSTEGQKGARRQRFEMVASNKLAGEEGSLENPRQIDQSMLKERVVAPRYPIVLNADPSKPSKERARTKAVVVGIYAANFAKNNDPSNDPGKISPSHRWAKAADRNNFDPRAKLAEATWRYRVAHAAGSTAVGRP